MTMKKEQGSKKNMHESEPKPVILKVETGEARDVAVLASPNCL